MLKKLKNKETKKSFDFVIFVTLLILLSIGITMVLSASSPSSLAITGSSYTYVIKQLISAIIGIIAMLVLSNMDYKKYQKFYWIIYWISFFVLLLVLVPGLGRTINGARRWINIPIFSSVQPSEITKLGLIVFYAAYFAKYKNDIRDQKNGFFKPLLLLLPTVLALYIFQSHLSAIIIIILVVSTIMLMAGSRLKYFIGYGIPAAGGAAGLLYILSQYFNKGSFRITRILSFLNPWSDAQGAGWQAIQSLYAIGSGGLFGVGLRK